MAEGSPVRIGPGRTIVQNEEFARIYREWLSAIEEAIGPGEPWAIVGIKRRGSQLARRLHLDLTASAGKGHLEKPLFGELDISLYRDDYHLKSQTPRVLGTEIPFSVEGRRIVLVDDVLFTGRTVRAAINLILDFGRPKKILLAVFIDRGHRELPIAPDFTGRSITTRPEEQVEVYLRESEGEDRVEIIGQP